MFRVRLCHKVSGNIIECNFRYGKNGEHIFFDVSSGKDIENPSEYYEVPYDPYELFGIECRSGWKELYGPILKYVEDYNRDKEPKEKLKIRQIKEKWAHLDLTFNFYTDELREIVTNAVRESVKVCEDCGSREDVGMVLGAWKYTTCINCLLKDAKERNRPTYWKRNTDNKIYLIQTDGTMEECTETKEHDIY